jgi:hypothetical protein
MTVADEGIRYDELFSVIEDYAGRASADHNNKALGLIADNYTPFDNLPMEETLRVVEEVLGSHGYLFFWGGRPNLIGLEPIATIALYGRDKQGWALEMLDRIERALREADDGIVGERRFWIRCVRREKHRIRGGHYIINTSGVATEDILLSREDEVA